MLPLYIGTYTQTLPYVNGKGEGIYTLSLHPETGALGAPRLAAPSTNPSFLALDAPRQRLFAVNELEQWHGFPGGAVSAFAIQPDGSLQRISQRLSGGAAPCYVSLEPGAQAVLVANYVTGTVARLSLTPEGALRPPSSVFGHQGSGPHADRQAGPHAHSILVDPSGQWALAADLGADMLYLYRLAHSGLQPFGAVQLRPGSGPRHFVFSLDGRHLYLANELDSTVSFFTFHPEIPHLAHMQTVSALPVTQPPTGRGKADALTPASQTNGYAQEAPIPNTLAHIHLHPSGRFLYASNRGHNSLAVFAVATDGTLTPRGHVPSGGRTPRNFAITPNGRFLIAANQDSDNLVVFSVNHESGWLTPTDSTTNVPTPVCVVL